MRIADWLLRLLVLSLVLAAGSVRSQAEDTRAALSRMVTEEVAGAGIKNPRVLAAMRATPRQEFVPARERANAFYDMALPIGHGQTISPPFVVAYMTEQLDPQPTDRVLEVGTGSGYQAAVLSPLVQDVYTIEIHEPLGKQAAATLARLGFKNVHCRVGDGYQGWPDAAPFDKIIVTCSPEKVPQPLVDQLREGGRLIVPVGERFQQNLYLFKKSNGQLVGQALEPTMFVPMTGTAEQERLVQPDGARPELRGGSFEQVSSDTHAPDGWYYLRQARVEQDETAPDGHAVITFANNVPGRSARALQAFAVDGRTISSLEISLQVRGKDVHAGATPEQLPRLLIMFYGEDRMPLGQPAGFGGWSGTFAWHEVSDSVAVPPTARMAILWIGLLGATGEASFDALTLVPHDRPSVLQPPRRAAQRP